MTLQELNDALDPKNPWFDAPPPHKPGVEFAPHLLYADESDISIVDLNRIRSVDNTGSEVRITEMVDGDEITHTLNKYQLRGAMMLLLPNSPLDNGKGVKVDLNNPKHNEILVRLTCMYYASGDVKDIWDGLDGEIKDEDFLKVVKEMGTDLLRDITETFNLSTESQVVGFLKENEHIFNDIDNLTIKG